MNLDNEIYSPFDLKNIEKLYVYSLKDIKRIQIIKNIGYIEITEITESIINDVKNNERHIILVPDKVDGKLLNKNLDEFDDYIYERYVNKYLTIVYGNCHTSLVIRYLENCDRFNELYAIYPILPIQNITDSNYFEKKVFKICDVFIHQSIQVNNRYGTEYSSDVLISKLKKSCRVISIPNVYHLPLFMYPQYYEGKELNYKGYNFFFRDSIIDSQVKEGKSLKEIIEAYSFSYFSPVQIKNSYDKFISKVKEREEQWDIKISDFIIKNIQTKQLFYDPNHPTNCLIKYYAEEIVKKLLNLNCEIREIDVQLDAYEMPMLACVVKELGGDYFNIQKELRKTGLKVMNCKMKLKQYILQYYSLIWTTKEFSSDINKKSKILFIKYRIINYPIEVKNKVKKLFYKVKALVKL